MIAHMFGWPIEGAGTNAYRGFATLMPPSAAETPADDGRCDVRYPLPFYVPSALGSAILLADYAPTTQHSAAPPAIHRGDTSFGMAYALSAVRCADRSAHNRPRRRKVSV